MIFILIKNRLMNHFHKKSLLNEKVDYSEIKSALKTCPLRGRYQFKKIFPTIYVPLQTSVFLRRNYFKFQI